MLIKRKVFNGYSETIKEGVRYVPAQVSDTLHNTIDYTEGTIDKLDKSAIGKTPPVQKKTRMVKNIVSGIKGFMPRNKKKKK